MDEDLDLSRELGEAEMIEDPQERRVAADIALRGWRLRRHTTPTAREEAVGVYRSEAPALLPGRELGVDDDELVCRVHRVLADDAVPKEFGEEPPCTFQVDSCALGDVADGVGEAQVVVVGVSLGGNQGRRKQLMAGGVDGVQHVHARTV